MCHPPLHTLPRQQLKLSQEVSELQRDMKHQATASAAQLRDVEAKLQQDVRAIYGGYVVCFVIILCCTCKCDDACKYVRPLSLYIYIIYVRLII